MLIPSNSFIQYKEELIMEDEKGKFSQLADVSKENVYGNSCTVLPRLRSILD